mmetsp:Transcript_30557/g.46602  ORF Transcript_30557/g.46602 Transcript_30557/m.46602 type:complete len:409 (+) Transcript_30557:153-1379(+)
MTMRGFLVSAVAFVYSHSVQTRPPSRLPSTPKSNFLQDLQKCYTPEEVLQRVGSHLTPQNDPDARVSSLAMVRLSKMLISKSNSILYDETNNNQVSFESNTREQESFKQLSAPLSNVISLSSSDDHDIIVEGMKAAGVIARIYQLHGIMNTEYANVFRVLANSFRKIPEGMKPHHFSGLLWAFDSLALVDDTITLPDGYMDTYEALTLPFRIHIGMMSTLPKNDALELTLEKLKSQVDFQKEEIRTTATGKVVRERRETAWQGDNHVDGFAYSGKVMRRKQFSPVVEHVRNVLYQQTGVLYDCCLLNLYPDGGSGMRYHSDPDQGTLWGFDTAVVSVGASRRFAFRTIDDSEEQPHMFVVMDGDVTEMKDDCQIRYQHTVKPAEIQDEKAPRSSLVFKLSLSSKDRSK